MTLHPPFWPLYSTVKPAISTGFEEKSTWLISFTLADKPKPWISEADGITYRYHNGRPLGQLIAAIRSTSSTEGEPESMLKITGLSSKSRLDATTSGTLYLRLNDHPAELADNNGTVSIEVREVE